MRGSHRQVHMDSARTGRRFGCAYRAPPLACAAV